MGDGRDAGLANQLAAEITTEYRDGGNFHNELNQILENPNYASEEVRRLALAQLEADGLLPGMIVGEFGTGDAMDQYGHNYAIDPPLWSDGWDNATPLSNEAQYFGLEDFEELADGNNEKPGERDPEAATQFLASAVVDRWDAIQGIARDQMFSAVDETPFGALGTIFEDAHDSGVTITDLRVWGGDPDHELADSQTDHAATVANKRPEVENAIYFATEINSNVPILQQIAAGTPPVHRADLGALVNDTAAFNALTPNQQNAVEFLYENWARIADTNEAAMTTDALESYANIMGTSINQAQQNVRDLLAMDLPAASAQNAETTAISMQQPEAAQALTLMSDSRLSTYIHYDSSNRPYVNRTDIETLVSDSSSVLTPAEKDLLRRIPDNGSALYLDQLALAAGYDNYSVMTGNRPVNDQAMDSIRNLLSSDPTFVNTLAGPDGFIDRQALTTAYAGTLTPNQRHIVSELLASFNPLAIAHPQQGINPNEILTGTVAATNDATASAQTADGTGGTPEVAPVASTGNTNNWSTNSSILDVATANLRARRPEGSPPITAREQWMEVANVLERAFNDRYGDLNDANNPFRLPTGRTQQDVLRCIAWLRNQADTGGLTSLPAQLKDGDETTNWTINTMELLGMVMRGTTDV